MDDTTHPVTERDDAVGRELARSASLGEADPILTEHLEKALAQAEDARTKYHLRAALQRLHLE